MIVHPRYTCIDVIICEDDPYYFLQLGEWAPGTERRANKSMKSSKTDVQSFVDELIPSFLKYANLNLATSDICLIYQTQD
jgi:hypothetical protein